MTTPFSAPTPAARAVGAPSRRDTRSLPPPTPLTGPQLHELESELRRELAALERRLINERADDSTGTPPFAMPGAAMASHRLGDTVVRRDAVAEALGRLGAGTYGECARCAAPIPFGRLLAMPEVTHCLSCHGES